MKNQDIAKAITEFATNLDSASCMGTRKDAVQFLANKIGAQSANAIAEIFGLHSAFYKAQKGA